MWGPVLGWCALELLAESVDAENPERVALDLFDRLRLREPFAQAFAALGYEGEEGWRAAARIKVVLLTGAGVGKPEEASAEAGPEVVSDEPATSQETTIPSFEEAASEPAHHEPEAGEAAGFGDERVSLSPALWLDPDVRWLTCVHETQGHAYLVREPYAELLWWLLMPSLLRLAGEPALDRAAAEKMSKTIEDALASAEAAGYRIDALLGPAVEPEAGDTIASEFESRALEPDELNTGPERPPTERIEPREPEIEPPVDSATDPAEPV
jgi:hypothetical protein